jgi:hypothetical protein
MEHLLTNKTHLFFIPCPLWREYNHYRPMIEISPGVARIETGTFCCQSKPVHKDCLGPARVKAILELFSKTRFSGDFR